MCPSCRAMVLDEGGVLVVVDAENGRLQRYVPSPTV
jgi:hypothetical protein